VLVSGWYNRCPQEANLDIVAILRSERDKVTRQLEGLNAALAAFAGSYVGRTGGRGRGRLSVAARARIAAAQRARWAKIKGQQGQRSGASVTTGARKGNRRTMSAAAKAKIAAAQRARWAKLKKGSKAK
jgi:hypothetical protein